MCATEDWSHTMLDKEGSELNEVLLCACVCVCVVGWLQFL